MSRESFRFWAVFGVAAVIYAATTHDRVFTAGNDASRWAQIESLVDHGSATIEPSRFARRTVDRVQVGDALYSNKPPFFALVGAVVYAPLAAVTGWRLSDPATASRMIWLLTVLLVGLPGAWLVAEFDRQTARHSTLAPRWRTALSVALGAGTLLISFAGTLNNHVPAAALLAASFFAALDARFGAAGLACGLAGAIDLLPGFGLAPFLAWAAMGSAVRRNWSGLGRFAAGLSVGIAATVAANLVVTGTVLFPKWLPGGVDLAARAGASVAGVVLPQSATYPLEILFGPHGLFAVSPVLVVGAVGWLAALARPPFGERTLWRAVAVGMAVQFAGHAVVAGSYGGWSYGYRYLLPIQPLLLFGAGTALASRGRRIVFAALLPVSILFSTLGAFHPWPPGFEQEPRRHPVADSVTNPIGANATALCYRFVPEAGLCGRLAESFVSEDAELRDRYLQLFFHSKGDLATMRRFER